MDKGVGVGRRRIEIEELQRIEAVYREHPTVKEIVVFNDRSGQLVALVVSDEANDPRLRRAFDQIASRTPGCARVEDIVSLRSDDPLMPALFAATGSPRRDVIWQFLVGCIETLTTGGYRLRPTRRSELVAEERRDERCSLGDLHPCSGAPGVGLD